MGGEGEDAFLGRELVLELAQHGGHEVDHATEGGDVLQKVSDVSLGLSDGCSLLSQALANGDQIGFGHGRGAVQRRAAMKGYKHAPCQAGYVATARLFFALQAVEGDGQQQDDAGGDELPETLPPAMLRPF